MKTEFLHNGGTLLFFAESLLTDLVEVRSKYVTTISRNISFPAYGTVIYGRSRCPATASCCTIVQGDFVCRSPSCCTRCRRFRTRVREVCRRGVCTGRPIRSVITDLRPCAQLDLFSKVDIRQLHVVYCKFPKNVCSKFIP